MQIAIKRQPSANGCTLSTWAVNGVPECVGLEDVVRAAAAPKIFGQTAIPAGSYNVIINQSTRFSALAGKPVFLPLLLNVPGYEGVRIHPGNFASDTEGCLLPGSAFAPDRASVINSRMAFAALFAKMQAASKAGEKITLTIS